MRYVIRRITHGLLLLLGVSILSFVLTQLSPGEFFQEMRLNPQISPQTIAALRARYGMAQPLPSRYFHWLTSALRGDLGFSFAYNCPVESLLRPRMVNTLILAVPATLLAWLIAIPVGIWTAAHRGSWADRIAAAGTSALLAIPNLVLALALLLLAVRTGLFPTGGMFSVGHADLSPWGKAQDLVKHMFLPGAALVLGAFPTLVRHVRASMIEVLDAPFVRTALAHGIPRRRILWRHVLPAAANPLISLFGISLGALMSASLLIEVIMSWPGLGPLVLEAILARDIYLVIGAAVFSTAFLVAGNLIADLMLFVADPRIRRERV
jgi:peptide/nickel transport system permease protein